MGDIEQVRQVRAVKLTDEGLFLNWAVQQEAIDREIRGDDIREWSQIPPEYVNIEPPLTWPETEKFQNDHKGRTFHIYLGREGKPIFSDCLDFEELGEKYDFKIKRTMKLTEEEGNTRLEMRADVSEVPWTYFGERTWCPNCGRKIRAQDSEIHGIHMEVNHHMMWCRKSNR